MSDIFTLDDALRMMRNVGDITGRAEQANAVIIEVEREFATLRTADHRRVVYLIWRKPWMATGQHTFIHDMLSRNGLRNAIMTDRYPSLTLHDLSELRPDLVLLSSEPFPFTKKHIEELRAVLPNAKFMLVDGEMFSWYGSRLRFACDYFKTLFSSSSHQQIADHSSS
jgi:ABC-type Fe3+-hydroxamate transport system substrate-binding protein